MSKSKKRERLSYVLLICLIGIGIFPVIFPIDDIILAVLFIFSIILFNQRRLTVDKKFRLFLFVFIGIIITQLLYFGIFPYYEVVGLVLKIVTAYLVVKIIGNNFINYYINIIYTFSLISFVFWIPSVIFPGFESVLIQYAPFEGEGYSSYIVYYVFSGLLESIAVRNAGPFWEAGVFGGFLLIAFMFNFLKNQIFFEKKNIVFILAMISTFSTTCYFAFFIFILGNYFINHKSIMFLLALTVVSSFGYLAYNKLPFLKNKVEDQITISNSLDATTIHRTRFTSAIVDIKDFLENPLFGKGKYDETRFNKYNVAKNRNNGTTDFIVVFGLIGFITYFRYYFCSFKLYINKISKFGSSNASLMLLVVMTLGFSELYFLHPFFWSICFLQFANNKFSY